MTSHLQFHGLRVQTRTVAWAICLVGSLAVTPASWAQSNDRGLDTTNLDRSVSPCEDFDQFANGTWKAHNPIPADYTRWGTWHEVRERNLETVHRILKETASTPHAAGSIEQKVGDFYATAMDTAKIEADGMRPIRKDLDRIASLKSTAELPPLLADYHKMDLGALFNIGVEQDLLQSDRYIVYATQGGLVLPDREYYLKDDDDSQKIRDRYVEHISNMLKLVGDSPEAAARQAQTILALETRLAKASLPRVEMRKPENYYNIVSVSDLDLESPSFSWSDYFAGLGLADLKSFSHAQPDFFAEVNAMLGEVPLADWQAYLRWYVITDAAPYLSSDFVQEDFRFFQQVLAGAEAMQPRWKRVQSLMNWKIGETIGQLYVAEAFPPEAKARALEMIDNLRAALKDRLEGLEWMGPDTRERALAKLATFTPKIGYPDKWRDYSALEVARDSYLANIRRADRFEFNRNLAKLGKPVDRTEWGMAPQIVNAYYNPMLNEVVFPAGLLQPPFFDFEADDALNYGAMGAVIGHELLHGFDDQGRKFDPDGNMKNWWTEEDEKKFQARAKKLVEQYNGFTVADGDSVNGELTLGENIADLGGLTMAYYALQKALEGKPRAEKDGFTSEQRFFLSWAQVWRQNARAEALKLLVKTNSHSPAHWRINGPLANMPEFYEAFGCSDNDDMVSPVMTRATIW